MLPPVALRALRRRTSRVVIAAALGVLMLVTALFGGGLDDSGAPARARHRRRWCSSSAWRCSRSALVPPLAARARLAGAHASAAHRACSPAATRSGTRSRTASTASALMIGADARDPRLRPRRRDCKTTFDERGGQALHRRLRAHGRRTASTPFTQRGRRRAWRRRPGVTAVASVRAGDARPSASRIGVTAVEPNAGARTIRIDWAQRLRHDACTARQGRRVRRPRATRRTHHLKRRFPDRRRRRRPGNDAPPAGRRASSTRRRAARPSAT